MSSDTKKTVIIICGPTASGKTSVALQIAKHLQTEIISADSRQCFKELHIGVARPSPEELRQVPHHFIASHSIHEEVTAATFEEYSLKKVADLFQQHDTVVMVGGTGLYMKAFTEGLDSIPGIDLAIREKITGNYDIYGLEWLQKELREKDPLFSQSGEMQNPQRMMRALEVIEATGQSIVTFRKGTKTGRGFSVIKIGLELPKEELYRNINIRTDKMLDAGLLDEVKNLLPYKKLNALQTVGYKELFEHLLADYTLEEAVSQIKTNTRQYAKRQMTWFRKDRSIHWFHPQELEEIKKWVDQELL